MTITMIIAIIAAVIFSVFCFLCVYFLFNNQKDARKNEERMKTLEYKMGLMGELISQKTDMLAEKMSEQEARLESAKVAEQANEPVQTPAVAEPEDNEETISLDDIFGEDGFGEDVFGADFEDVLIEEEEPVAPAQSVKPEEPDEPIEPIKPIEPVVPVTPVQPVEITAWQDKPTTPSQGTEERYATGKSGRKYSFSELEGLIRE